MTIVQIEGLPDLFQGLTDSPVIQGLDLSMGSVCVSVTGGAMVTSNLSLPFHHTFCPVQAQSTGESRGVPMPLLLGLSTCAKAMNMPASPTPPIELPPGCSVDFYINHS